MIVHIVMFKFKENNKEQNLQQVKQLLQELLPQIKELKSIEVGINLRKSDRAWDMSLYSTFDSLDDLSIYATHPSHLDVLEVIRSVILESKVVDYETTAQ